MRISDWSSDVCSSDLIVTLTSTTVNEGVPNHCDYVATNAALVGASRVLAKELGQYGITVTCQALGLTRTAQSTYHVEKMIELGLPDYFLFDMDQSTFLRVLEPLVHVGPILFLLSFYAGFFSFSTLLL